MNIVLAAMAVGVGAAYFTIAALIVPRIELANASRRFRLLFHLGAVSFFVGCGLTHLHMAMHAVTDPARADGHEMVFHVMQLVGGWAFIIVAVKFLKIRVERRGSDAKLAELEELALRDPLTGAYNRRYFDEVFAQELARCERHGGEASLMLIDIDDFKRVNDEQGHAAGDRVLADLTALLTRTLRPSDTSARLGGDELAVLLPATDQMRALSVAERVRAAVNAHDFKTSAPVHVSIGIASCPQDGAGARGLTSAADRALYWAKRNGKDMSALSDRRRSDAIRLRVGGAEAAIWSPVAESAEDEDSVRELEPPGDGTGDQGGDRPGRIPGDRPSS